MCGNLKFSTLLPRTDAYTVPGKTVTAISSRLLMTKGDLSAEKFHHCSHKAFCSSGENGTRYDGKNLIAETLKLKHVDCKSTVILKFKGRAQTVAN